MVHYRKPNTCLLKRNKQIKKYEINILELGFGTGLNVLVTLDEYLKTDICHKINYYSLEKYPLKLEEATSLEYDKFFENEIVKKAFTTIHCTDWGKSENIEKDFFLQKVEEDFYNIKDIEMPPIDLVYFDCFGARVQPDLWEEPLVKWLLKNGIGRFVHYLFFQRKFTTYPKRT